MRPSANFDYQFDPSLILCTSLHDEPGWCFCFAWAQMHMDGGLIGLDRKWLDKVSGGNGERMAVTEVEGMTMCEACDCALPWRAMTAALGRLF